MEYSHPDCTMLCKGCNANFDYIMHTPRSTVVKSLLEMPTWDAITMEKDLPNTLFPSDHIRVMTELEVFYNPEYCELI